MSLCGSELPEHDGAIIAATRQELTRGRPAEGIDAASVADGLTGGVLTAKHFGVVEAVDEVLVELTLLLMAYGPGDGAPGARVERGSVQESHERKRLCGYRAKLVANPVIESEAMQSRLLVSMRRLAV